MQGDTKKQLPVLIALSLVLVLAVGYSVVKSLSSGPKNAAAPTAETAQSSGQQTAEAVAVPQDENQTTKTPNYGFIGKVPRDPFQPKQLTGLAEDTEKTYETKAQAVAQATKTRPNLSARLPVPPLPLPGSLKVEEPGRAGFPFSQTTNTPEFTATGFVRGSQGEIAVLRGQGGSRYFVRQGEKVGDGFVVSMITPAGVVLKSNNRRVFLKLGGAQDAKANNQPARGDN